MILSKYCQKINNYSLNWKNEKNCNSYRFCGLVGSEAVKFFIKKNFFVVGIDNNLRKFLFGKDGDTSSWKKKELLLNKNYQYYSVDIRNLKKISYVFSKYSKDIKIIIHSAAQPSHDWAKDNLLTDFSINAEEQLIC